MAKDKEILSPLGRIVVFGVSGAVRGGRRSLWSLLRTVMQMPRFKALELMDRNIGVWGLNVGHLWSEAGALRGAMDRVVELYSQGRLRPRVAARFPFEDAAGAHRHIHERRNIGKVVLTP